MTKTATKVTSEETKVTTEVTPIVTANSIVTATKKCALHHVNFPEESEIRVKSEFYGEAKSSYCRRCMLIHHRNRNAKIREGQNVESRAYEEFVKRARIAAEHAIEWREEGGDELPSFVDRMIEALRELEIALDA